MKTPFNNDRSTLMARLMCGTMFAVATLAVAMPTVAQTARPAPAPQSVEEARVQADEAQEAAQVDDVVVTGTSIRGVAPVGSNVISVTQEDIQKTGAQTVQQLLKSVPQVTGFNNAGQGGFGSADGSGTNAPTIHSLGASASNNTLILIDGNRVAPTGLNHALSDPSIVPPIALERVEVLPEGASSVYGSDAVAGVLNFITRRRYDGFEATAQVGFGDGYRTYSGGLIAGTAWDTGSAFVAY
ncbi:MAG TPA: TonB-dependent receptor plug domain-containing protein, partial [Brevundimonas sp.]